MLFKKENRKFGSDIIIHDIRCSKTRFVFRMHISCLEHENRSNNLRIYHFHYRKVCVTETKRECILIGCIENAACLHFFGIVSKEKCNIQSEC